jgi:hypothetical protein
MGKLDYDMNQMEMIKNGVRSRDCGDSNEILHAMNSREFLENKFEKSRL